MGGAELEISAAIEGFYDRKRRHSSLGNPSPTAFEHRSAMTVAKAA